MASGEWNDNDGSCSWGPAQFCPHNHAICGFKYEYEPSQKGHGDDSALTNVKMMCCRECDKTESGKCCAFPFQYNGQTYNQCTDVNNNGQPWCATTKNYAND